MGGFFEYSYADYDGSANSYSSDGKINAYAVGALARFDLTNNFFIDSYAKIGKLNNNYTLNGYDNLKIDKRLYILLSWSIFRTWFLLW